MSIVYLNGQFVPQEKATVSIMDRGFLFGDGVYEVVPIFQGKLFRCDAHLARLDRSLNAIQIKNPHTITEWKTIFHDLLTQNKITTSDHSLYCQVTRGADTTRNHLFSDQLTPTVVAFLLPVKKTSNAELEAGYAAITSEDDRRSDGFIKAIDLLPAILKLQKTKNAGAFEAILIRNNAVTECISSNVFIVKNNVLITPPVSRYILRGITRDLIITLARENNISVEEKIMTPDMLKTADEIWVTGSTKELAPIVTLDNQPVGNGKTGPLWHKMKIWYEHCKETELK
ncbi:MAG TPA: D-amino acid aminotransferase [Coxiellaceae bacterium]|nr:D-amino acid aminotransferase [Coxiellaceae bacterium]